MNVKFFCPFVMNPLKMTNCLLTHMWGSQIYVTRVICLVHLLAGIKFMTKYTVCVIQKTLINLEKLNLMLKFEYNRPASEEYKLQLSESRFTIIKGVFL